MPDTRFPTLALVTDTHVRVNYDDGQQAFPSDAHHNDRNLVVADVIRKMAPDLIIHLGDVVHPIPPCRLIARPFGGPRRSTETWGVRSWWCQETMT